MGNDARRLAILGAIGIDVYRLRGVAAVHPADGAQAGGAPASTGGPVVQLVVAAAPGMRGDPRIAQLVRAVGAAQGATAWVEIAAGGAAPDVPDAPAYLMIGPAAARACSAQMPIARQQAAAIAVVDAAAAGGAARRALWQSLKPLARRLRANAV